MRTGRVTSSSEPPPTPPRCHPPFDLERRRTTSTASPSREAVNWGEGRGRGGAMMRSRAVSKQTEVKVARLKPKTCHVCCCHPSGAQANAAPRCANAAFAQQHLKSASGFRRAVYSAESARFFTLLCCAYLSQQSGACSPVTLLQRNK